MNAVRGLILNKLENLEALSEPVLQEVLDFVSYLEWRLISNSSVPRENFEEDTGSFLLELASSFASGLSDQDLAYLPTDGAENHDRYLHD